MRRIGPYDLITQIGEGGMGSVYRGRHHHEGTARAQGGDVAIKVMHATFAQSVDFRRRFAMEAEVGQRLVHPNLVRVLELVDEHDQLALVMEWIDGRPLSDMMGESLGPMPWEQAWPIVSQILDGMAYAHRAGVVHRDLKPENVMVTREGDVRVLDFGIAKSGSRGRTQTGTRMGTVDYMAPEQYRDAKSVDQRADIYAIGVTIYEMLAGRLPWDNTTPFDTMTIKNLGDLPPPTNFYPYIAPHVVAAIMASQAVDPNERPKDIDELRARLLGPNTHAPERPSRSRQVKACLDCACVHETANFCPECGTALDSLNIPTVLARAPRPTPQDLWIGRESPCDILIPARSVSAVHARVRVTDHGVWITDLGSSNGLRWQGERVHFLFISHQDAVELGHETLRWQDVDHAQTSTSHPRQIWWLGADASCDIHLPEPSVSGVHAAVYETPSGLFIEDLESTNGLYVDDIRVCFQAIEPGQTIRFGRRTLTAAQLLERVKTAAATQNASDEGEVTDGTSSTATLQTPAHAVEEPLAETKSPSTVSQADLTSPSAKPIAETSARPPPTSEPVPTSQPVGPSVPAPPQKAPPSAARKPAKHEDPDNGLSTLTGWIIPLLALILILLRLARAYGVFR